MQLARPSRPHRGGEAGRGRVVPSAVAVVVVVLVAAAVGAALTGAGSAPLVADPGAAVRWGLPLVSAVDDLAAAVTVGVLVLVGTVLPAGPAPGGRAGGGGSRAYGPALRLVCAASGLWALAGVARLVLGYAAATGQSLQQPDLGTQLVSYVTQVEAGRWAAAAVVLAALTATLTAGAARLSTARLLVVPAVAALAAEVVAAHAGSGGLSGPGPAGTAAVAAIGLHVAGVALWIGPLAGLLLLGSGLGAAAAPAVGGYARSAGWTSGLVAVSGALAAWQQLGGADALRTGYGVLVAAKVVVLVLLVAVAARHRRRVLPAVAAGDRGALARAAAVELVLAALAIGASGALAATDPPAAAVGVALAVVGTH